MALTANLRAFFVVQFRWVHDAGVVFVKQMERETTDGAAIRFSMGSTRLFEISAAIDWVEANSSVAICCRCKPARGLVWVACQPGRDLRAEGLSGHATLVRASDDTRTRIPVFQPEAPALAALATGLRQKFDPKGILNPGLMG